MKKKNIFLLIVWMIAPVCWAKTEPAYDYPFLNPYEATVIGTPKMYSAPAPMKIPVNKITLTVFEDRKTPDIFWYLSKLNCSLAYQDKKAPLVFSIAGTGAAFDSAKMLFMQRTLFDAGFHVISLTSPLHPEFIVAASESMVPGHIVEDARDLYRVMGMAWDEVKDDIEVSDFYLTGYSLGAAQAAFVSHLDEQRKKFNFQKVLIINPPVNFFNSATILESMLEKNLPGGTDNAEEFLDGFFAVLSQYYNKTRKIDITDSDLLYDVYKFNPPRQTGLAAMIGISFRLSSSGMIFTSDVMKEGGYIVPSGVKLTTGTSLTDLFIVSKRTSFTDYFHEYLFPYFHREDHRLNKQELIEQISLKSIASYLKKASKIGLMHNEDDVILAPGEIDFFRKVFGPRAKIYPVGGHCGNMQHHQFVKQMIHFFVK